MKIIFRKLTLIFVFSLFLISCEKDTPLAFDNYLVSTNELKQYTKAEFITKLSTTFGSLSSQISLLVRSGLKTYKITYNTKGLNGEDLIASGAIVVPTDIAEPLALVSFQHGTINDNLQAPSYFNDNSEASIGMFFSSVGYIIAMPDYLGYGESKAYPHPYENRKGLAQANVDFLLAVKEFIKKQNINWNQNLMIGGYSEGGYATLSTQKMIEEEYPSQFNLRASSCGAGAYNKTLTIESFLKTKTSGEASNNRSYIWVLLTYNRIYGMNRPASDYFIQPYAADIEKNGYNVEITKSFDEILNPVFVKGLENKTETKWIEALKDNDIVDWKTKVTTKLYHGDKDTFVPFFNSESALNGLKAKGSANVTLERIVGGTHGSSINSYFLGTLDLFNTYKN